MGMIAEENKKNIKLEKRIKRLGLHILLINKKDAFFSANYMKGKSGRKYISFVKIMVFR